MGFGGDWGGWGFWVGFFGGVGVVFGVEMGGIFLFLARIDINELLPHNSKYYSNNTHNLIKKTLSQITSH